MAASCITIILFVKCCLINLTSKFLSHVIGIKSRLVSMINAEFDDVFHKEMTASARIPYLYVTAVWKIIL